MKISAVVAQFPITFSVQTNLEAIQSVLAQTQAGDLVIFPEGCVSGYSDDTRFLQQLDPAEVADGLRQLQQAAQQRALALWVGACTRTDGLWFNAAYGFFPDGSTQVYHKINLATHERGVFSAGDQLPVFDWATPNGSLRLGVQLCRELRYPEQWGWLARRGAQIILHLNNAVNKDALQAVWKSHLISRAAETQRFVLSANNAAAKQLSPTLAVAPDGQVLGEIISAEAGLLRVELDLDQTSSWYLDQCREDVVAIRPGG